MTKSVFLVEDELLVAMEIQDLIEEAGLTADGPYPTIEKAGKALQEANPACAILDVRLRDGEVFPVADVLRDSGVPLIFHSGHAVAEDILKRYPTATFCEKPCTPSQILRAVASLMGRDTKVA
ncbi:response regulator [Falsirhodobacter sp. 1013]|uniref:response regulator n=1 Tax=Falsirhodobacter sp. 1013 TaxID=3417566 RepID=UPI003EBDB474